MKRIGYRTHGFEIAVVILLVTCLNACKPDAQEFKFQPDTANYFNYKNFASWVYKSTQSNTYDTVLSIDFSTGLADRPEGLVEVTSNTLVGDLHSKVIIRAEAIPRQNLDRIAVVTLVNNQFIQGPVLLNLNGAFNPEDSSVVTKLLTFEAAGTQYQNIWEVTLKNNPVYKHLWFAPQQGIIKKVYANNDTFELIKFSPGR